jgi:predicted negative regulator of RcsB-dependent stress response
VDLLSEEEQWDALKRWVRTNGPSVLGLVLIMLAAYSGWTWWKRHTDQQALAASAAYDGILLTFDSGKTDDAIAQIEALRRNYPKSAYVVAADLAAAKVFVGRNELDKAVQRLESVANNAPDKQLRPIARLRLARVQSAQGQYDKALATLAAGDAGAHQSAYAEVRGDVLLAKGDAAAALKEYMAARKLVGSDDEGIAGVGESLDLKINDLRATISATTPNPAPPAAAAKP